jgi:hypothetical protein
MIKVNRTVEDDAAIANEPAQFALDHQSVKGTHDIFAVYHHGNLLSNDGLQRIWAIGLLESVASFEVSELSESLGLNRPNR